jgi:SAM-dependent methyltransferase
MVELTCEDSRFTPHPKAVGLLQALGSSHGSDQPLFLAGYSELCRIDLDGKRVLEICGGAGHLAGRLAEVFPGATIIGLDRYEATGPEVDRWKAKLPGLSYVAGDAMDLSGYEADSFDLVFGQASLHHLAHDIDRLRDEVLRVLKPGGRFVFIFEPLGHNPFVAAIRAFRFALAELGDESNLYVSQFEILSRGFSKCEVQTFNLLGYGMKAARGPLLPLCRWVQHFDRRLMRWFPRLKRQCANCNLVLTK